MRLLPLAALLLVLYGCAPMGHGRLAESMRGDEGTLETEGASGALKFGQNYNATENFTLLPQPDGSSSALVITTTEGDAKSELNQPFQEARVQGVSIDEAQVSNTGVNNRYADLIADTPIGSFRDVVRRTVLGNPEVQARWQDMKISRYQRNDALSRFLPALDFFASIRAERVVRPGSPQLDQSGVKRSLTLTQNLFEGFGAVNDTRTADHTLRARFYTLLDISEEAAYEAARAHMDVRRYTQLSDLAKENLDTHQEVYDLIVERAQAGVDRRVDLELALGRLALAKSNLTTEQANLHDVSARYIRIVGERPAPIADSMPASVVSKVPASMEAGLKDTVATAPAVMAALETVRASEAAVRSTRAAYLPTLDLRATVGTSHDYAAVAGKAEDSSLALVMNWNVYRGNGDQARTEQYGELLNVSRYEHESVCREVRYDFEKAYNDYTQAKEKLIYLEQHQLATEKALQAYRQQFTIGQRTLLDMLDSQNEYFEAQRDYISGDHAYQMAAAKVLEVSGMLMKEFNVVSLADKTPEAALDPRGDEAEVSCSDTHVPQTTFDKEAMFQEAIKFRPQRSLQLPASAPAAN